MDRAPEVAAEGIEQGAFHEAYADVGEKGRMPFGGCPSGLFVVEVSPKVEEGGGRGGEGDVYSVFDDGEQGGEVLLEGGVGCFREPLWWQTLRGDAVREDSVYLDLGLQDEVGQGGEASDAVLEGEARPRTIPIRSIRLNGLSSGSF